MAICDGSSRKTLDFRLSHTLETEFCVDCLEEALRTHGKPEIFNSDQGARFTRQAFTNILNRAVIVISKEGWGRVFDKLFAERLWRSVKHEHVSLKGFATMDELRLGLTEYFAFHNAERPHRSLGQQTPEGVYRAALNGGATIVDGFAGGGGGTRFRRSSIGRRACRSASRPNAIVPEFLRQTGNL